MLTLTPVERAVLDGASHSPEALEQIYLRLHTPPASVPLFDVADAVRALLKRGLLKTVPDGGSPDDPRVILTFPFSATPEGREVLVDGPQPPPDTTPIWRAPIEATSRGREVLSTLEPKAPAWPRGQRARLGMFAGQFPDVPFEVFKENRREMSGRYSGDSADD